MNTESPKPSVRRSLVRVWAWVLPELKESTDAKAEQLGVTVSEYIASLLADRAPRVPIGSGLQQVALVGHRAVATLDALRKRADAGGDLSDAIELLQQVRRDVAAALLAMRGPYDESLDGRELQDDNWSEYRTLGKYQPK